MKVTSGQYSIMRIEPDAPGFHGMHIGDRLRQ